MYNIFLQAHSGFRYIVMVLLLLAVIQSLIGRFGNKPYLEANRKINLFTLISAHIQLLGGLVLYFVSPMVMLNDMGAAMKNDLLRYWSVEHITMMIIAIVLITVGHARSKKKTSDIAKHSTISTFYTLALVVIVATIIMSGRGLFGMTHIG